MKLNVVFAFWLYIWRPEKCLVGGLMYLVSSRFCLLPDLYMLYSKKEIRHLCININSNLMAYCSLNVWLFPFPQCMVIQVNGCRSLWIRTLNQYSTVHLLQSCTSLPSGQLDFLSVSAMWNLKLAHIKLGRRLWHVMICYPQPPDHSFLNTFVFYKLSNILAIYSFMA